MEYSEDREAIEVFRDEIKFTKTLPDEFVDRCLDLGRSWAFRSSAGNPCLITLAYGYLAAALAELASDFIYSANGAWDRDALPMSPDSFYASYFRACEPEKSREWDHHACIAELEAELAALGLGPASGRVLGRCSAVPVADYFFIPRPLLPRLPPPLPPPPPSSLPPPGLQRASPKRRKTCRELQGAPASPDPFATNPLDLRGAPSASPATGSSSGSPDGCSRRTFKAPGALGGLGRSFCELPGGPNQRTGCRESSGKL